ncbi:gas vesicle protein GvpO [Streptomyces fradiae]|uniref:gas vesicle protein GvpO n=1 Tax=Streptomyces fradiae TaxID=1906 RepID=UPI0036FEC4C1
MNPTDREEQDRRDEAGLQPEAEAGAAGGPDVPAGAADRVSATEALRQATRQLAELLGRSPESVSALKPTDQGWTATVEVLELERVPETSSVMASYEVALGPRGELLGYERGKRYTRAQIDRRDR